MLLVEVSVLRTGRVGEMGKKEEGRKACSLVVG